MSEPFSWSWAEKVPTSYPSPEGATPPADGAPQPVESPPLDLPAPPEATDSPGAPGAPTRVSTVAGVTVIVLLCAVCLGLAFRSGAYRPVDWLPFLIGVAALAVVAGMSGPAVLSGRVQKVLLGLFGAQAAWTAASLLWATSTANAWEETNRTLFYATAMTLVFVAVRWTGALGLRALVMLVTAAIAVMALVVVVRLGISDDFSRYFPDGRLQYPVGYFNGLASLLMIGFWLALGMANGSRGGLPRWIQPLLLALGVLFAELALLPQSRGALWTFFLAVPFFLILSTNRFRALVDLAIVVLPVALFWSQHQRHVCGCARRRTLRRRPQEQPAGHRLLRVDRLGCLGGQLASGESVGAPLPEDSDLDGRHPHCAGRRGCDRRSHLF